MVTACSHFTQFVLLPLLFGSYKKKYDNDQKEKKSCWLNEFSFIKRICRVKRNMIEIERINLLIKKHSTKRLILIWT